MVTIREYAEENDSQAVGVLIAETYRKYNLDFATPEEQEKLLGPFRHAGSTDPAHQEAITRVLRTEKVFVAEDEGQIVGVLRCKPGRLQSLFVREDHHRHGIGRKLVERCEQECIRWGSESIRLAATLYAVPFYTAVGYKKSTGIRNGWSFEGQGLQYQPMKKDLIKIDVVPGNLLADQDRQNIISFCTRAYEEDMQPFFDIFAGATHVLGMYKGMLVSHALWITRHLQVGSQPLLRTAYVEAVATEKAYRNRGFASAIMKRLVEEVQDYDLAALSPFSVAYYERLGWEAWQGPLFIRTEHGCMATPDSEEVMILRLPNTPDLDLSAPLSAEWREGELW